MRSRVEGAYRLEKIVKCLVQMEIGSAPIVGPSRPDFLLSKPLIRKHAATYGKPAPAAKSGCFVATVAFGDVDSHQVVTLRSFRDEVLLHSRIGRLVVRIYYCVSPTIAARIERSPRRRAVTRAPLERIIRLLPSQITEKKLARK